MVLLLAGVPQLISPWHVENTVAQLRSLLARHPSCRETSLEAECPKPTRVRLTPSETRRRFPLDSSVRCLQCLKQL
jgi:hypothetical protein